MNHPRLFKRFRSYTTTGMLRSVSRSAMILVAAAGCALLPAAPAQAHETDQYSLPVNRPMADVGDWLDCVHTQAVEKAVRVVNAEIERALRDPDPVQREKSLAWARRPEHLAYVVLDSFNDPFTEILDAEHALRSSWAKDTYRGAYAIYSPSDWIYGRSHFWLDPRNITLMFRSGSVKAYGVYFGTDKLSHFHHMGSIYYGDYMAYRASGMSDAEATAAVVRSYADTNPIAERGLLGFIATGVYSNADLAANFMGLKFCINVTEPVVLKGELREPMIVRRGEFFRVNQHIRPESGWFGYFVSDHWNEAFNPCWYDFSIRSSVHDTIRERAAPIRDFYTRIDGRPDDPAYYRALSHNLATYDGEEYGHSKNWDKLLTLDQVCWPSWHSDGNYDEKPEDRPAAPEDSQPFAASR